MNFSEISNLRLVNQQVFNPAYNSVKEMVGKIAALQAQDFNMSKWAMGTRLSSSTHKKIEAAFNKAEILRTHLLRPTWHIVSAKDIYWLLKLTAPQIKSALKFRQRELELTESVIKKSYKVIADSLKKGEHLTRDTLVKALENSKIKTNNNRASHIFLMAELDGLVCSGIISGKKQTYALLEERVPEKKILYKDEALAELAGRYFATRGPATLQDFGWWSGLSISDSKHALEMIRKNFISETINSKTFWFKDSFPVSNRKNNTVHLLPAYDEFIISYKDRSPAVDQENIGKAVSNNGIFRPIIIYNGKVIGIWKTIRNKDKVLIEARLFKSPGNTVKKLIKEASLKFGKFLNEEIECVVIQFA